MAISNVVLPALTPTALITSINKVAITVMYLCNTTADDVTVDVYCVPNGQTAGDNNKIYSQLIITGHDTYLIDMEKLILESGDSVVATVTAANALTVTISSIEV